MATLTKRVITLMNPDLIARIERQAKIEKEKPERIHSPRPGALYRGPGT